jgi:hypothetical protein
VVEAQDVALDLGRGSRRDEEIVFDLNLGRRHLSADARECGGVHDGAAFDGDDFRGGDRPPKYGRQWYSTSGALSGGGLTPKLTARKPCFSYSRRAGWLA